MTRPNQIEEERAEREEAELDKIAFLCVRCGGPLSYEELAHRFNKLFDEGKLPRWRARRVGKEHEFSTQMIEDHIKWQLDNNVYPLEEWTRNGNPELLAQVREEKANGSKRLQHAEGKIDVLCREATLLRRFGGYMKYEEFSEYLNKLVKKPGKDAISGSKYRPQSGENEPGEVFTRSWVEVKLTKLIQAGDESLPPLEKPESKIKRPGGPLAGEIMDVEMTDVGEERRVASKIISAQAKANTTARGKNPSPDNLGNHSMGGTVKQQSKMNWLATEVNDQNMMGNPRDSRKDHTQDQRSSGTLHTPQFGNTAAVLAKGSQITPGTERKWLPDKPQWQNASTTAWPLPPAAHPQRPENHGRGNQQPYIPTRQAELGPNSISAPFPQLSMPANAQPPSAYVYPIPPPPEAARPSSMEQPIHSRRQEHHTPNPSPPGFMTPDPGMPKTDSRKGPTLAPMQQQGQQHQKYLHDPKYLMEPKPNKPDHDPFDKELKLRSIMGKKLG